MINLSRFVMLVLVAAFSVMFLASFIYSIDPRDKKDFFKFARVLSWSDGDFDAQEKHIVETLEKIHMDESSRLLLRESKMEIQEIPLEADQWTKTIRNKGILSLLGEER